jgi:DNA-binding MarR family transcriptional regulator
MLPNTTAAEHLLLHDVQRAQRNATTAALARRGLTDVGQPKVLIVLASLQEGAFNQRELAEALHISPPTMAASLKSLERQGYVTKQLDEKDGRCKRVAITPKGLEAVNSCKAAFDSVDQQLYAGFTEQEVEQLISFYHRMLQNLYDIGGMTDPVEEVPPTP